MSAPDWATVEGRIVQARVAWATRKVSGGSGLVLLGAGILWRRSRRRAALALG